MKWLGLLLGVFLLFGCVLEPSTPPTELLELTVDLHSWLSWTSNWQVTLYADGEEIEKWTPFFSGIDLKNDYYTNKFPIYTAISLQVTIDDGLGIATFPLKEGFILTEKTHNLEVSVRWGPPDTLFIQYIFSH